MGALIGYFTRGWRGDGAENVQNLIDGPNPNVKETSLTNPYFIDHRSPQGKPPDGEKPEIKPGDDYQPVKSSELRTLPPDQINDNGTVDKTKITNNYELFLDREIDFTPLQDGDRYQEINSIVATILQLYKPIVIRKNEIKKSLQSFKELLGLEVDSSFSKCFNAIRSGVHSTTHLELICGEREPLKLKINELSHDQETIPEDLRKSVTFFNTALNHCQKFKGEKELKVADIQYKLDDLHLMPLTREGQQLFSVINEIPTHIEDMSSDIECLYQQIYEAQHLLRFK